ncbi:WzyE family oligosaccharide polymerase, partial [Escherichia coli]|nr:WzyE family oligosaccharide polymerase [Escherichia coli]
PEAPLYPAWLRQAPLFTMNRVETNLTWVILMGIALMPYCAPPRPPAPVTLRSVFLMAMSAGVFMPASPEHQILCQKK